MRGLLALACTGVCWLISSPAHAGPGDGDAAAAPASVWDLIEEEVAVEGPSPEEAAASEELAEERLAEQAAANAEGLFRTPDVRLLMDPFRATEPDPLHLERVAPGEFDIPVTVNDHVVRWMKYFTGSGRKYYARWLNRRARYEGLIHDTMDSHKLPRDLLYVSMIESGFSPYAHSWAEAVGLWQFIVYTGRAYGLRVDYWVDERRDPEKATVAAARYLKDLKRDMGDWYLAWASYNGSPGRVNKAIRAHDSRNFWVLAEHKTLHEETRNYVPKILAAAIIGKHPERYGFTGIQPEAKLAYDTVPVQGAISVEVLAKAAGVPAEDLHALNPALLRGATPPEATTDVRVPPGLGEKFAAAVAKIPESERIAFQRHTVRKGESLGTIASRYGVSVSALASFNHISNPNKIYPGMVLVIPGAGVAPPAVASSAPPKPSSSSSSSSAKSSSASPAGTRLTHTVGSGESLSGIADRYGVSLAELKGWNNLRDADHIEVGQKLVVYSSKGSSSGGSSSSTRPSSYTVRKGDTLSSIAARYDVSTANLVAWNNLKDASAIQAGQVLKLSGSSGSAPKSEWKTVTVGKGDTLSGIAAAQGCSVSELKSWNNLKSSTIVPGQKLKVKAE